MHMEDFLPYARKGTWASLEFSVCRGPRASCLWIMRNDCTVLAASNTWYRIVNIVLLTKVTMLCINYIFRTFFFFLSFMEALRLGVKLELQLPTYATGTETPDPSRTCGLCHSSWQCWILNPPSRARDWICVFMDTSKVRYCWTTVGTPGLTTESLYVLTTFTHFVQWEAPHLLYLLYL